jgi:hypothetical protein
VRDYRHVGDGGAEGLDHALSSLSEAASVFSGLAAEVPAPAESFCSAPGLFRAYDFVDSWISPT